MLNKKKKNKFNLLFVSLFSLLGLTLNFNNGNSNYVMAKAESPFDNNSSKTNIINGYDFTSSDYNGGYVDFVFMFDDIDISSHVNYNIYNIKNEYYCSFSLKDDVYTQLDISLNSLKMFWSDSELSINSNYLIIMSYFNDVYNESTFEYINSNNDIGILFSYNDNVFPEDNQISSIFSSLYYLDSDVDFDISGVLNFGLYSYFGNDVYTFNFNTTNDVITYHLFDLKVLEIFNNTDGQYSNTDSIQANYNYGYNTGYDEGNTKGYTNGYDTAKAEIVNNDYQGKTYSQIYDLAYNRGLNNGSVTGYQNGVNDTIQTNYHNMDYNTIYNNGKSEGYTQGINSNYSLVNEVKDLVNLPFTFANNALNFDILGLNMYDLFTSCITLLLLIWVIKRAVK